MGEVWEAEVTGEQGFHRRVAIKRMVDAEGRGASFARMFLDEAKIASQLHHANIVAVLDFGLADGAPFQVLEYVDGLDAHDLLSLSLEASKPLPVGLALHICTEVAHALHHAHQARGKGGEKLSIVHRDVTPANILVSWAGDVKLSDFGIAFAHGRLERTVTGVAKGKPAYMAPEQAVAGDIDPRTDVFALGCVLHTLVSEGHSPLAGENRLTDLLAGIELPLDPSLEPDVRDIVRRAVRRSKHDRFESAAAFAQACGRALYARVELDAKTLLQQYMLDLRAATKPPVPAAAPNAANQPTRLLSEEQPPARSTAAERSPRAEEVATELAPRRWRKKASVAVGALALLAFAVVARVAGSSSSPPMAGSSPGAERSTPEVDEPTTPSDVSGALEVTPVAEPAAPKKRRERSRTRTATGVLVVGGVGAHRREVFVDGSSRGHAPMTLELPVGSHTIELTTPSGERRKKTVVITSLHTSTSPLTWRLPEE